MDRRLLFGLVVLLLCVIVSGQNNNVLAPEAGLTIQVHNATWQPEPNKAIGNTTVAASTGDTNDESEDASPSNAENRQSLFVSLATIAISEVGDKTFLIACIMAMKHPRLTVFSGAFASLSLMAILSAWLGHVVPNVMPKSYTDLLAAILFFFFGLRMLWEGWHMKAGSNNTDENFMMDELEYELQEDLEDEEQQHTETSVLFDEDDTSLHHHQKVSREEEVMVMMDSLNYMDDADDDETLLNHSDTGSSSSSMSPLTCEGATLDRRKTRKSTQSRLKQLINLSSSPVFVQTFVLTFLGEWGDKSQISTIALAASNNVYWVATGVIVGHGICTGLAVIGGRILANKISVRTVTLAGAILFLIFSVVYAHHFLTQSG